MLFASRMCGAFACADLPFTAFIIWWWAKKSGCWQFITERVIPVGCENVISSSVINPSHLPQNRLQIHQRLDIAFDDTAFWSLTSFIRAFVLFVASREKIPAVPLFPIRVYPVHPTASC